MAVGLGSECLFCNHTRQFLYLHWHLKFDRCDGRFEQFGYTDNCPGCANARARRKKKRWIIQNIVVLAWKQSCRRPPKVTNDKNEHAIVLLWPPRNGRMRSLSAGDIALRATEGAASPAFSIGCSEQLPGRRQQQQQQRFGITASAM